MTDKQKLEAIKAEIERRKNEAFLNASFNECKQFILNELQKFIASLDEQSEDCDTCINDKGCVTCENGELYEGKPNDYTKNNEEQKERIEDLKKQNEILKHIEEDLSPIDFKHHQFNIESYLKGAARGMEEAERRIQKAQDAYDEESTDGYSKAVEKACKWLDKMALSSIFINSFKKAMEEGEE